MARRKIIRDPKQASFEFILLESTKQERAQAAKDRKLVDALNSCSTETKQSYVNMLRY
jgi:hypothetical protein